MCDALAPPMQLEGLTVSDNALGEKGVRACATPLSKQRLQRLTLENVGASSAALAALSELMTDAAALRQVRSAPAPSAPVTPRDTLTAALRGTLWETLWETLS